jgi:hypothetical protein
LPGLIFPDPLQGTVMKAHAAVFAVAATLLAPLAAADPPLH